MPDIEFWVSTTGNDLGDGTQNNPFLTIGRAQTTVREVLAEPGPLASDVIVNVDGGTYELPATLDFGPTDSGRDGHAVIFRAVARRAGGDLGWQDRHRLDAGRATASRTSSSRAVLPTGTTTTCS